MRLAGRCAQSKPQLVNIKVEMRGKQFTFALPENSKLAPNLERMRVPLEFECGFSCSCGTCAVKLSEEHYDQLLAEQPILESEERTMVENSLEMGVRLSCQLTIKP